MFKFSSGSLRASSILSFSVASDSSRFKTSLTCSLLGDFSNLQECQLTEVKACLGLVFCTASSIRPSCCRVLDAPLCCISIPLSGPSVLLPLLFGGHRILGLCFQTRPSQAPCSRHAPRISVALTASSS